MKTDHSFTFTAAVILAGVVLAFVNPADATSASPALASTPGISEVIASNANTLASVDVNVAPASKGETSHKGSCNRTKRTDPRA